MVILTPHMTDPDGKKSLYADTSPGMAHFGGTGPEGRTCCECKFWQAKSKDPGKEPRFLRDARTRVLLPRRCEKFKILARQNGLRVPFDAKACRYFVKAALPPPYSH